MTPSAVAALEEFSTQDDPVPEESGPEESGPEESGPEESVAEESGAEESVAEEPVEAAAQIESGPAPSGLELTWKQPENTRWLAACLFGLILATLVGGFSFIMAAVLVAVFLIGATLIASAATDAFILYDFVHNAGQTSGHLISIVQTGFVIIMGLAAAFGRSSSEEAAAPPRAEPSDQSDHAQVLTRIEDLFASEGLHRSEDLTLRRLSRRLGLPDRRISEAVNRLRGVNLSQFVNEHRIRDACVLLRDTDQSILQIALAVGFASKSNFNREFQRVVGQTPSGWRAGKGAVS